MNQKIPSPILLKQLVEILEDLKMTNIQVFDTQKSSIMFDNVIIATCNSVRQAYAAHRDIRKSGIKVQGIEGQRGEEWLLADCGDVIVHMMLPKIREHFNLEELYQGALVNINNIVPSTKDTTKTIIPKIENKQLNNKILTPTDNINEQVETLPTPDVQVAPTINKKVKKTKVLIKLDSSKAKPKTNTKADLPKVVNKAKLDKLAQTKVAAKSSAKSPTLTKPKTTKAKAVVKPKTEVIAKVKAKKIAVKKTPLKVAKTKTLAKIITAKVAVKKHADKKIITKKPPIKKITAKKVIAKKPLTKKTSSTTAPKVLKKIVPPAKIVNKPITKTKAKTVVKTVKTIKAKPQSKTNNTNKTTKSKSIKAVQPPVKKSVGVKKVTTAKAHPKATKAKNVVKAKLSKTKAKKQEK